jgi:hypothetical protein
VVGGAKKKEAKPRVPLPPPTRTWSPRERVIIDLHFYYLTNVWSLNDWKVYHRYKKHLPAESRFEVDTLVDLMMRDLPKLMRDKLEAILAVVWDAEDWLAVIAHDELARDLDAADQNAWRQRVARSMLELAIQGELHDSE